MKSKLKAHTRVAVAVLCTVLYCVGILQNVRAQQTILVPTDSIGTTFWDVQTLESLPTRIHLGAKNVQNEQLLQVFWLGSNDVNYETRGTYYAPFTVKNSRQIDPKPTQKGWVRQESNQRAWVSSAVFADERAAVVSQLPLRFMKNLLAGEDSFTSFETGASFGLNGRLAIGKNDRSHVIYGFAFGSNAGSVGYVRSDNEGNSWSSEQLISGLSVENDAFAIDARGNTVVVVAVDKDKTLRLVRSDDNGETWSAPKILLQPQWTKYSTSGNADMFGNYSFRSDTSRAAGYQLDVMLDNNNDAHIVCQYSNVFLHGLCKLNGVGITRIGRDTANFVQAGIEKNGFVYYRESASGVSSPEFFASPASWGWNGAGKFLSVNQTGAFVFWPRLGMDSRGILFCAFSSIKPLDKTEIVFGGSAVQAFYSHAFLTYKRNKNSGWSDAINISPDVRDCQYFSIPRYFDSTLFFVYQEDNVPGQRSSVQSIPHIGPSIVKLGSISTSIVAPPVSVRSDDNSNGTDSDKPVLDVYFDGNRNLRLRCVSSITRIATVEIFSQDGKSVFNKESIRIQIGSNDVNFDLDNVAGLSSGIYYVVLTSDGLTMNGKFFIIR